MVLGSYYLTIDRDGAFGRIGGDVETVSCGFCRLALRIPPDVPITEGFQQSPQGDVCNPGPQRGDAGEDFSVHLHRYRGF